MGLLPCPFPVLFPQRRPRPFTAPSSLVSWKGAGVRGAVGPEPPPAPRALPQGGAWGRSPCPQPPGTVAKASLCRAAPLPCSLRASVRQVGATAEDASTGGPAGNWQAVHSQLSERVSAGLLPQLLQKG